MEINRYRLWSFAASLLLASLCLTACTGSPAGSNTNSAGPKPADTTKNANGSKATPASAPSAPGYEGFQDDINCNNVIGWAWDSQHPNEPVKIEILDGSTSLGTVAADLFRQDLLDAGKGNGKHSFNYALPAQVRDGKSHTIRVKVAGTDADLAQTSKTITCKPE